MDNEMLPVKYADSYSQNRFFKKLNRLAKKAGKKLVVLALTLYYCLIDEKTPVKIKVMIVSALGYFILPTDIIPDFIPATGLADDLSILFYAYNSAKTHITEEHKSKAETKSLKWLGKTSV